MSIWKTEWGWRAELLMRGERVRAKGFFRYKDEARRWVKEEKQRLKANPQKSSLTDKEKDQSLWSLSQKYLADCKVNYSGKTFGEKKFCLERFYEYAGDADVTMC